MDWDYVSVAQKQAGGRKIHYAQGKTLGGSSAINTMAYHRPTYGAHQKWADAVGDQSYSWLNFLKYYTKSTHLNTPNYAKRNMPNSTFIYDPFPWSNGPLEVSYATWVDPTITWLAKAIRSLGLYQSLLGFNSGFLLGCSAFVTTTVDQDTAVRTTSRNTYLENIGLKAGVKVYHHSRASKIIFSGKKATNVKVLKDGNEFTLNVKKEVIVSAGVFGSPKLLMVSGVGPAATLRSFGIPVVSDLQGVGKNLWDQLYFQVANVVTTPSGPQQAGLDAAKANAQYTQQKWGPLSSISAYIAFEKVPQAVRNGFSRATKSALSWFPPDWPEVEYVAGAVAGPGGTTLGVMSAVLTAPLSRGSVTISSADPLAAPVIDLGWFTDPADGEVAVAAIKRARQAWTSISSIKVGEEVLPGAAVKTDAQILEFLKAGGATQIWHAGATCAMGKSGDSKAVVDSKARVFGTTGLRVVDASALPFMLPGHPQATIYALAEKIADDIIQGR